MKEKETPNCMKSHLYFLKLSLSGMLLTVYCFPCPTVLGLGTNAKILQLKPTGKQNIQKCHNKILIALMRCLGMFCRKGIRTTVICSYFKIIKNNEFTTKHKLSHPSLIFIPPLFCCEAYFSQDSGYHSLL